MNGILQDVRYSLRQLRRNPGFAAIAVITLALGIGANSAISSIVYTVLLRPLPYPDQGRLIGLTSMSIENPPQVDTSGMAADYIVANDRLLQSAALFDASAQGSNLAVGGGKPEIVHRTRVSAGFFATLGVEPKVGRGFAADEDRRDAAAPVAVISDGLWRNALGGARDAVGKTIRVDGREYQVVGIMPASFVTYPAADLWTPLGLGEEDPGYYGENFGMVARMKPGVTLEEVRTELRTLWPQFLKANPKWKFDGPVRWSAYEYRDAVAGGSRSDLLALAAAVAFVLLIACTNLAALLLSRASTREREIAMRISLGATRARLIRMLLTESVLLSLIGGVLGLAFAYFAVPALLAASPAELPRTNEVQINLATLAYTFALSTITALLFGVGPAWRATRSTTQESLRCNGQQSLGLDRGQRRLGRVLVASQTALTVVLLVAASLLVAVFAKLHSTAPGFQPKRLYALQVNLTGSKYATTAQTMRFVDAVVEKMSQTPDVTGVAAINGLPLDRGLNIWTVPVGRPNDGGEYELRTVTSGFFTTGSIPLITGRALMDIDTTNSERVAVINETLAKRWWPGQSPIGQYVTAGSSKPMRIIGVVADMHEHALAEAPRPTIFAPLAQVNDELNGVMNHWFAMSFVVRAAADVDLSAAVQQAVAAADPEIPVVKLEPMETFVDESVAQPRFYAWLASAFGGFALLLTVVGLFGVLSYQVAQRTREFGVRMALGADRADVMRKTITGGLLTTMAGVAVGAVGAVVAARLLSKMFYGVHPPTVLSVCTAAALIVMASVLASYLPAWRASRVDPIHALRCE